MTLDIPKQLVISLAALVMALQASVAGLPNNSKMAAVGNTATVTQPMGQVLGASTSPSQWSIGYYLAFEPAFPVSAIQWNGLTHIIHVAALVNADGTLDLEGDDISTTAAALVAAAHAHNVKALLCLMAVGDDSANFNLAIANHLSAFVTNIVAAVNTYGYDGVDLDWEPSSPGFGDNPASAANMLALAPALRTAIGSKVLTAAVNDLDWTYWSTSHTSFDRISIMSYNMCGPWNPYLWYTAPLFGYVGGSLNYFKTQWLDAGFPAAKLALGVPFSAWKWTGGVLSSDHAQGISGPLQAWQAGNAPTGTIVGYSTVASLTTSENYNWDPVAVVPYLSSPGTPSTSWYVTYENPQSIQAKIQYIIAQNLGGWIIWNLHWDYVPGDPHPHPLLDAIAQAMGSVIPPPDITLAGNSVVISWPSAGNYILQQNTDLASGTWAASGYAITTTNGLNSISIRPPIGSLFFRLKQ